MQHQIKVYAVFFLYSLVLGSIFSRIGELQLAMGVGEAALGLGLLGFAIGTQISLMFSGGFVERIGYRRVILFAIPLLGVGEILAASMPSISGFFACLVGAGICIGMLEIVINLEADRTEHMLGRRIMNRSHAFWSFGFFAAGIVGAVSAQLGIEPAVHMAGLLVVVTGLVWAVFYRFEPAPVRISSEGAVPRFVRPSAGILLVVVFTLSAMLLEGAESDWSVIFMRDSFEVSPFINGMAFASGALAQAITRYFADPYVDRYGPVRVAKVLISVMGVGVALVVLSAHPAVALIGFALIGVGSSSIFPLAMSAAAQRTDRPSAVNVASLAQLSFVVFLVAPPLLGFVAEHYGIRYSFGIGMPLVIISWFTAKCLAVPK